MTGSPAHAPSSTVEQLRTGHMPAGDDAFGLAIALHEAAHAYGVMREGQATCYAVQLVPAGRTDPWHSRSPGCVPRLAATLCSAKGPWDLPRVGTRLDPPWG